LKSDFLPKIIQVRKGYPTFQIVFLGHSLGGVLANLAAIDFVLADGNPASVSVITFGTPRFANLEFVNWLNSIPFKALDRYVTQGDIVPNLPMKISGFYHTKNQKSISGGTISNCIVDETKDDPKICLGRKEWVFGWSKHRNYFGISSGC